MYIFTQQGLSSILMMSLMHFSKHLDTSTMKVNMLKAIINYLQPFEHFPEKNKELIANNAQLLTIPMGQYLFTKGEHEEFSYYLVEGKVEIQPVNKKSYAVYGGTAMAKHPLSEERPHEHSAKAASHVKVLQINQNILQTLSMSEDDVMGVESESEGTDDWMTRILESELITNIPSDNIHLIFNSFEQLNAKKGNS